MKLAILKGGTNITFSGGNASAANADILYFLKTLKHIENNFEVDIITHKTRNTLIPKEYGFKEILEVDDYNSYDAIILFNFSINFFGGKEDPNLIKMYRALHKTKKKIFYIQTDGAMQFKQLWPSICKRVWAQTYTEEEFYVDSEQVYYITQGYSKHKLMKEMALKHDNILVTSDKILHYPHYATILSAYDIESIQTHSNSRPFDFGFGGAVRNSHKRKLISKYYDYKNSLVFGNLSSMHFINATRKPKVAYQQVIPMMQQCKATITIGDKYYNDNFFTLRMFESLLAGCIVFIDEQMDSNHLFYPGQDWLYVNSRNDIDEDLELSRYKYHDIRNEILEKYNSFKLSAELLVLLRGAI